MARDSMSPASGKMLLPDNTVIDIAQQILESTDAVARKFAQIDHIHNIIHRGQLFRAFRRADVDAGASAFIRLLTGARPLHLQERRFMASAGEWIIRFHEGPSITGGTIVPIYNSNRLSANVQTFQLFHTPATPSGGIIIDELYLPATLTGPASPFEMAVTYEWVLKPNTEYAFQWNNIGGQARMMQANWIMYELPPI
jgi:hypothetical protein